MKRPVLHILLLTLLLVPFGLLGFRLFTLQCPSGENEQAAVSAPAVPKVIVPEKPQRGTILDRKGNLLAASNRTHHVFAEPRIIEDVKETALALQQVLDYPGYLICRSIHESKNPGYVKILKDIPYETAMEVRAANLRGIGLETNWKRYYPQNRLFSHVIGFVGAEENGLSAIELEYDHILSPGAGSSIFLVDASRKPIAALGKDPVRDGASLVLTLDATIQEFTRQALEKQILEFNAPSGLAIVMDPYTGEILAMVSLPDFDPQDLGAITSNNAKNRALTDPYEPGSIFKPIVAALALDGRTISTSEKIYCEEGNYHGKGFGRIGEYGNHQYANMTVKEIIAKSSNIGMAKIGQKMGVHALYSGLRRFGFGQKTGIDLPGEDAGVVRDEHKWNGYSVTRVPFGHEVTVTAIQMIRAYAILANGGSLVRPHLLKAAAYPDGTTRYYDHGSSLAGRILRPEVAKWMVTEALTEVVNEGTGKKAALEDVQVFGKTGTANIAGVSTKGYDAKNYVASFAGGAPAENPQIVVLVSVHKPDRSLGKGYTGGTVAGPVAAEIIKNTLKYLNAR